MIIIFLSTATFGSYRRRSLRRRPVSSRAALAAPDELLGHNAYEVLGVSEGSKSAEIKSSFRKLAKENHPDVAPPERRPSASRQFLVILAAYEVLSDPEKRAHYDSYLCSQREVLKLQRQQQREPSIYTYNSSVTLSHEVEVVEWLKCYKLAVDDILSRKRYENGSGYWNDIQNGLYAAIHAAYYGPLVKSMEVLPACFEGEERSTGGTSEVLHLVSGRYLFGIVHVLDQVPILCHSHYTKLDSFAKEGSAICDTVESNPTTMDMPPSEDKQKSEMPLKRFGANTSDAYKDLELQISGQVVARATRSPPEANSSSSSAEDYHDKIHVFLKLNEVHMNPIKEICPDYALSDAHGSMILLGTIKGLGTSPEEGSCFVYDRSGAKTHLIMKHRTFLVKHMHWFSLGDNVSTCECRCSRARLPSSKYWLFQPRCSMHDVGGWYIETFGHDKDGKTVLSQRQWDGNEEYHEKRLHPAIYLLALAYRTLDIEVAKRKTQTITDIFVPKLHNVLQWCKRLI